MWWRIAVVAAIGCSGDDKGGPTTGDDDDDTTTPASHSGTAPTDEPTGGTLPDVDAECWAWRVSQSEDGGLAGTYLYVVDPDHLEDLRYEADYEPDGAVDYVAEYAWLDGTHRSSSHLDDDGDGAWSTISEYDYDSDLVRVEYRFDDDGDGAWDEVWTYLYVGEISVGVEVDEGDDGTVDVAYAYTYDVEGRLERVDGDRGLDAVVDEIYTYVYAAPGSSDYTYTSDSDADGVAESTSTYTFDSEGRTLTYVYASPDGTSLDLTTTYVPGTVGDVATRREILSFSDGSEQDGTFAYTWVQEELAATMTRHYVIDGSAEVDYTDTWTWTCPERGL